VTENVTIRAVERELGQLRAAAAAPGELPKLRTSVMTHMAWVPERWVEVATETLGGLAERHPSRTILLFPRPNDDRDALDAEVDLRCFRRGGEEREVCSEVISIRLCGKRASAPASVIQPLLVPDLPVFLRWRGECPWGAVELEELVDVTDRLIVDSSEWPDVEWGYARLGEILGRVVVSDIAWARIELWRRAVAALWPDVADAAGMRIAGPYPEAALLARWLAARLDRHVELQHEPAGEIELVEVDGRPAVPLKHERPSASDLLSDQLEIFDRDRVYEETIRTFSSVPT
jgi:Glucose-6-phosphate dehydrogenase subunit N-terminal domain/Glucose-6-phosphate dehydrogenase subunit C-terminal domain